MNFSNTYINLPEIFYQKTLPTPVKAPKLLLWNSDLAEQLMIPPELCNDPESLAHIFVGNRILPGSEPLAAAYAGHQFGHFVPQLGDGRAHLLGEVVDHGGHRSDIQLKGSGRTSFSRGGDGRCAIGPALREFIMSEAMYALRVPTTRCLAVVATGEKVFRDTPLPGAVVTRIAASHLRVGTFEYFAARGNFHAVQQLCDYAIDRHYPQLKQQGAVAYVEFIDHVIARQIELVVEWMRVGFIHGVMNTDNTSIAGETIDYGPCAMMGIYDPNTVYSSIDRMGRYAFGQQSNIIQWNMSRLVECLLPLIDDDYDKAVAQVEPLIAEMAQRFEKHYMAMMAKKLGLLRYQHEDNALIGELLQRLNDKQLDYTVTFHLLTNSVLNVSDAAQMKQKLGAIFDRWQTRLKQQGGDLLEVQELMRRHNPVVIPRNHHVERVIQDCQQNGTTTAAENFLQVVRSPYVELKETGVFQDPPRDGDRGYHTFCGT